MIGRHRTRLRASRVAPHEIDSSAPASYLELENTPLQLEGWSLQIAQRHNHRRSLRPRSNAELLFHALNVKMYRRVRNADNLADVGVGFAIQNPLQAFEFTRGQRG